MIYGVVVLGLRHGLRLPIQAQITNQIGGEHLSSLTPEGVILFITLD